MGWQFFFFLFLLLLFLVICLFYRKPSNNGLQLKGVQDLMTMFKKPEAPQRPNPETSVPRVNESPVTEEENIVEKEELEEEAVEEEEELEEEEAVEEEDERVQLSKAMRTPEYLQERYSNIMEMLPSMAQIKADHSFEVRKRPRLTLGQYICQITLETIFQRPFPEVRPNFLKNPETGRNLELDGYNESLALAYEFNGTQHIKWPNHIKRMSLIEFKKQCRRDIFKAEVCRHLGIHLMQIPQPDYKNYDTLPLTIAEMIPVEYDLFRTDLILSPEDFQNPENNE